jgi:hypothetical protein
MSGLRFIPQDLLASRQVRKPPHRKRHLRQAGFRKAQLAFGAFYFAVAFLTFYEVIKFGQ